MTQTYPFTRGAPGAIDYTRGQRVFEDAINNIDKNAAQAADGLFWTDVAMVRSFRKVTAPTLVTPGTANRPVWDSLNQRWVFCGNSSAAPTAHLSYDGREDWISQTVPAGSNWGETSAGAANAAGVILMGGATGTTTASKIRQSTDGGSTWTARNTVASSSESVNCLGWHSGASLFVLGLSSAASTNIETSPDGQTWTQRTGLPNSVARRAVASNGSSVVVLNTTGSKCIRSSNAISWTEGTLPTSTAWRGITWWARQSVFVAIGDGALCFSTTGTAWSSAITAPFATAAGIAAFGRMLIATGVVGGMNVFAVSVDGGQNWTRFKSITNAAGAIVANDNQILCFAGGDLYSSLSVGF